MQRSKIKKRKTAWNGTITDRGWQTTSVFRLRRQCNKVNSSHAANSLGVVLIISDVFDERRKNVYGQSQKIHRWCRARPTTCYAASFDGSRRYGLLMNITIRSIIYLTFSHSQQPKHLRPTGQRTCRPILEQYITNRRSLWTQRHILHVASSVIYVSSPPDREYARGKGGSPQQLWVGILCECDFPFIQTTH